MSDVFYSDLNRGLEYEIKHLEKIKERYPDAYKVKGYCKEYDIYIPSKGFGVEIKMDKMSQQTGNIVVEIEFDGKPSALSTTKAKYWIFDTGVKEIIVRTETLRKLVKRFKTVSFKGRGDLKYKKAYLIKQYVIESIGVNNIE